MPQPGAEHSLRELRVGPRSYRYCSLAAVEESGLAGAARLPFCLKVLLENVLRQSAQGRAVGEYAGVFAEWLDRRSARREIAFRPSRILMPDSSGIPLFGDLAAMRDATIRLGGAPSSVNPAVPVDLIVDHSVAVDASGAAGALARNAALELERNAERYRFLRWAAQAFDRVRVIPPGKGILHQINLEHLARVVWVEEGEGGSLVCPDTLLGMDSHTAMINSLGVVGWGVGGLEGGAALLGEAVDILVPEVIGCRLSGRLQPGVTSTDLVLTVTQALRRHKVVDKFVEYFGPGVDELALPDRATLSNMTPEYGATMGFFPVDAETLRFLRLTGRDEDHVALVEAYARAQGLWRDPAAAPPLYSGIVDIDLSAVVPSVSGPRRPQERVPLHAAPAAFREAFGAAAAGRPGRGERRSGSGEGRRPRDGDVVIAAPLSGSAPIAVGRVMVFTSPETGALVYDNHELISRWNYQLTKAASFNLIGQYISTLPHADLTDLPNSKTLFADALFTYMPHPGTALYFGYIGNFANLDRALCTRESGGMCDPGAPILAPTNSSMMNDGKTIYMKISYLLRF